MALVKRKLFNAVKTLGEVMGNFCYYLATSLDGYLAREDGSVDWLNPFQSKLNTPYDYEDFYKTVSTVIMGRKTWEVARSFEKRPYSDRKCYILSQSLTQDKLPEYCQLIKSADEKLLNKLKKESTGRIWIVGGAHVASRFLELGFLDEIVQTIVPVTIGRGIPWFEKNNAELKWKLNEIYSTQQGVVQLVYQVQ